MSGEINTNFIKERADASLQSTIDGVKSEVVKKEEVYDIRKAMYEASQNKLAALKSQMNSPAYADNSDLKAQCKAWEAQASDDYINFDVASGSLGNSRNYYNKISIFENFMS